jgi:hypothetical protein
MAQVQPADISHVSGSNGADARWLPATSWHGERSMADHDPRTRDEQNDDGPGSRSERSRVDATPASGGRDVWRASASFGWLIGALLLLLAGAGIVVLLLRVPSTSGGQRIAWISAAVALTALTIGIAVVLRALPTMRYRFAGDALIVEWLGQRRVVPLSEITAITFEPSEPLRLPGWEPFWPGYYVARVRTISGTWHSWATQQPHRRVRLSTASGIVAISPERPVRFIAELERRQRAAGHAPVAPNPVLDSDASPEPAERPTAAPRPLDARHDVAAVPSRERGEPKLSARRRKPLADLRLPGGTARPGRNPVVAWLLAYRDLFRDRLLADPVASALVAVGVVLPVLMLAYLYSQYEGLPGQIPIQWDASGDVAELTSPSGLWRFPRIAVAVLVVNTALATLVIGIDRYLARLLVAGIPLTQLILAIALIRAIN